MRFQKITSWCASHVRQIAVGSFFALALAIGAACFSAYGASYDDWHNQWFGDRTFDVYSAALHGDFDPCAADYCSFEHNQIHGPLFETAISAVQNFSGLSDEWYLLLIRHGMVFLLFWLAAYVFYRLCLLVLKDWRISLLGAGFLFISPRIFSDSFYNSVDIGALAAMIFAAYALAVAADQASKRASIARVPFRYVAALGAVIAAAVAMRSTSVIALVATGAWFAYGFATARKGERMRVVARAAVFALVGAACALAFMPILWDSPADIFKHLLLTAAFSAGPWGLYMGSVIPAESLPWHYNLVWIGMTTPLLYIGLFLAGLWTSGVELVALFRRRCVDMSMRSGALLFALAVFFGPIVATIVLNTSQYNGWRHIFFIYPAFIFVALIGLSTIWKAARRARRSRIFEKAIVIVVGVCLAITAIVMVRLHPFEHLYFNALYWSPETAPSFDIDYWGMSYHQALEYILRTDSDQTIPVFLSDNHPDRGLVVLTPEQQARISIISTSTGARYLVTNHYPLSLGSSTVDMSDRNDARTIYSSYVGGVPVFSILRLSGK